MSSVENLVCFPNPKKKMKISQDLRSYTMSWATSFSLEHMQ